LLHATIGKWKKKTKISFGSKYPSWGVPGLKASKISKT
jgi:hypothetical protein